MNATQYSDIRNHLFAIAGDKVLLDQFSRQEPDLFALAAYWVETVKERQPKPVAGPFPLRSQITAVQAALFDNWPGEKPVPRRNRYGMQIEFWTAPADQIKTHRKNNYQRKADVRLLDGKEMQKWCRVRRRDNHKKVHPLSDTFLSCLEGYAATSLKPNQYIGLLEDKRSGEGTVLYDMQFAIVTVNGSTVLCEVMMSDDWLPLAPFSPLQANGVPWSEVAGNIIMQSRTDLADFSANWATDLEAA